MPDKIVLKRDSKGNVLSWVDEIDGVRVAATRDPSGKIYTQEIPEDYGALEAADTRFLNTGTNIVRGVANLIPGVSRDWLEEGFYESAPLADYAEANYPGASMGGDFIATFPSMLLGNKGGIVRQMGVGAGVGAAEQGLGFDPRSNPAIRTLSGALSALGGDAAGRLIGKVFRGAAGAVAARQTPVDEAGQNLLDRGYKLTRPSDAMPEGGAREAVENMETAVQKSGFRNRFFGDNPAHNQRIFAGKLWKGFGLPERGRLGQEQLPMIERALSARQAQINSQLSEPVTVPEGVLKWIKNIPDVKAAKGLDTFPELTRYFDEVAEGVANPELPKLDGSELVSLRSMLTQSAANMDNSVNAMRVGELIDDLDTEIAGQIGDPAVLADMAKMREQWQLYFALNNNNVFGKNNELNLGAFNRRLASRQGLGDRALHGDPTAFTSPEIAEVVGDSNALNQLKNQDNFSRTGMRGLLEELANPPQALASGAQAATLGAMMREGGNPTGAINAGLQGFAEQAPAGAGLIGRELGANDPSMILDPAGTMDRLLYPFVGSRDDRQQQ